jgi:hypothetical protein
VLVALAGRNIGCAKQCCRGREYVSKMQAPIPLSYRPERLR